MLDEDGDLQVFVGNHVVRDDKRPRLLTSEVLTLPANLEIAFRQSLDGFPAILRTFLLAVFAAVQALQVRLLLAQETGVLSCCAPGGGGEAFLAHCRCNVNARGGAGSVAVAVSL